MKRRLTCILIVCVFVLGAVPVWAAEPPMKFIRIGGGGMGGAWYLGAAKMASYCEKIWPGISASSTAGGGVGNLHRIEKGEFQIAFAFTDIAANAYKGLKPFTSPMKDLRFLCSTNPAYVQTVAVPPIKSYYDLEGKKACAGTMVMTGYEVFFNILKAYGIEKKVTMISASYDKMVDLLVDGIVSADSIYGSVPHLVPNEILTRRKVNFLPIEEEKIKKLIGQYEGMVDVTIPPNSFKTQDYPVRTVGSMTCIVARADVPDEVVYKLLKYTWERKPELVEAHVVYKEFTPAIVPIGRTMPWHPGAEKFWKEIGVIK